MPVSVIIFSAEVPPVRRQKRNLEQLKGIASLACKATTNTVNAQTHRVISCEHAMLELPGCPPFQHLDRNCQPEITARPCALRDPDLPCYFTAPVTAAAAAAAGPLA